MKRKTKLVLGGVSLLLGAIAITGCTQSFCSNVDIARMVYAFDPGITRYEAAETTVPDKVVTLEIDSVTYTYTIKGMKETVAQYKDEWGFYYSETDRLTYLNNINNSAKSNGLVPITSQHIEYLSKIDAYLFEDMMKQALYDYRVDITRDFTKINSTVDEEKALAETHYALFKRDISYYSYLKYVESDGAVFWGKWNAYHDKVKAEVGLDKTPNSDFRALYVSSMNSYINTFRTCLTTKTDKFGSYGYSTDGIYLQAKTWGYAWNKGFFEGLLVYPIGWLIDQIGFGFRNSGLTIGAASFLAIVFVTLIVRGLMMLTSLKQTGANAKMNELQPEIQKIQNKYPNANSSQVEKQRMAEEMNRLYKKNKINPFSSLLMIIIQFPVFICVWGALSGSALLTSGTFIGMPLSQSIKDILFNGFFWGPAGNYAAVTALFLFLFMSLAQAVSMLLPQWIQKAKAKKVAKLGKNPAQKSQGNKMKWFTYIMLAMIIFMGFTIVSAMGIYWFIGAIISVAQTLITQAIVSKKAKAK